MIKFKEGIYKKPTGFVNAKPGKRNSQFLSTSRKIEDELWSILNYYSEIDSIGIDFIKNSLNKIGIIENSKIRKIYKGFSSNIRQAKGFYYSAKTLPVRSSPLLYYYSFMNLVKAKLIIEEPRICDKKLHHGLSYSLRNDKYSFKRQKVEVKGDGIFPLFYKWYFNKNINVRELNINKLFNYCTDIAYEYEIIGNKGRKILYCKYVDCVDDKNKTCWPLIAVYNANEILKYKRTFKDFLKYFEKVDLNQLSYKAIFNISSVNSAHFTFFQGPTKNWISDNFPAFNEVNDEALNILKDIYQYNHTPNGYEFYITIPYSIDNQIRLDEIISIYIIVFYLSNLVRYNPRYFDYLLNKKEAWLINAFMGSCIVTFLRSITSIIINQDFVYRKI